MQHAAVQRMRRAGSAQHGGRCWLRAVSCPSWRWHRGWWGGRIREEEGAAPSLLGKGWMKALEAAQSQHQAPLLHSPTTGYLLPRQHKPGLALTAQDIPGEHPAD